jgi:tripartite-type tricarboxylate transporter receptor subunit TctC
MNHMFLAPARTPRAIIDQLNRDAGAAFRQPDAVRIVGGEGNELVLSAPGEAAVLLRSELARWAKVIKQANLKPED